MKREHLKIIGIKIDNLKKDEIEKKIREILEGLPQQRFVATLNPEIILKARGDADYQKILNSSDMGVCDGIGLRLVSKLMGKKLKDRYPGADLLDFILRQAGKHEQKVLVVSRKDALSSPREIIEAIWKEYQIQAKVEQAEKLATAQDRATEGEVIVVNLGAPWQEEFIFKYKKIFPQAKLFIGVGGSLDFLTGKISRAPVFLRRAGFEWMWRLCKEPKRIFRILNAVVVFPVAALTHKE